jgi:acyl-lipid omega-6 desaturase (Delta-12 desaturase)
MPVNPTIPWNQSAAKDLPKAISSYALPNRRKAILQIVDTFVPFLALWAIMVWMVYQDYSYWIILALAVPTAGFQVRIFILFHDCCHGSFFSSKRANTILGYISGILTFTPFSQWRRAHATHHEYVGDLDRRGVGDIWIMTVEEYLAASLRERVLYRFVRNPYAMLLVGPIIVFLIIHRFFRKSDHRQGHISVIVSDIAIALIILSAYFTIGLRAYCLIQAPVMFISGAAGLWLFYVQHQFEGVYWARHDAWNRLRAALEGSSYYKLPKLLQWFTGNIGLHHIHHVQQRIPNYNLQRCLDEVPALQKVEPLTMRRSLKSLRLNLWDEKHGRLVSFKSIHSSSVVR